MFSKFSVALLMVSAVLLLFAALLMPVYAGGQGDDLVDPAPPPPGLPADPYGAWFLPPELAGRTKLHDAGALWTTVFLRWNQVEASPGVYDWSYWDQVLTALHDSGYEIVVTVLGNPSWAADTTCGPIREEALDDFATFMGKAAARYRESPRVRMWALYNEPDNSDAVEYGDLLGGCWGDANNPHAAPGAGGDAYANMLKHVYPAIKAANPDAYVAIGGLAYDYFTIDPGGGLFDPAFLEDVAKAGGADYFDFLNFHYYPWTADIHWEPEGANRYEWHLAFKGRWITTEVYNLTGQRKPIMITEVGETSHNKDYTPDYRRQIHVIYETFMHSRMIHAYPIIWFTAIDLEFSINYDGRYYGLLHLDGSPKPSYYAYKTLVEELKDATFVRPRDDLPARFEGYEFNDRGHTKTVLWMYPGHPQYPPPQPVDLPVSQKGGRMRIVRVKNWPKTDADTDIVSESYAVDGGEGDHDGWVNGKIRVMIDEDYQFFEDLSAPTYTPTPTPTHSPTPTMTPTPTLTPTPTATPVPRYLYLPTVLFRK